MNVVVELMVVVIVVVVNLIDSHPAPGLSPTCAGPELGHRLTFAFETHLQFDDETTKNQNGYSLVGQMVVINTFENSQSYLLKIVINKLQFNALSGAKSHSITDWSQPLFVRINHENGQIIGFYVHQSDHVVSINLKKKFAEHLLTTKQQQRNDEWTQNGQQIVKKSKKIVGNEESATNVLMPQTIDQWEIVAQISKQHSFVIEANGWQNVTFKSLVYEKAHSSVYLKFKLKLLNEEQQSSSNIIRENSIENAIKSLGNKFKFESNVESRDRVEKPCDVLLSDCRSLFDLIRNKYETNLDGERSMAKISMSIAYLRLIERIRLSNDKEFNENEINKILNHYKSKKHIFDSILDLFAGARTLHLLKTTLKYLNLPQQNSLVDSSERFLTSLSLSSLIYAKTSVPNNDNKHTNNHQTATISQIIDLLYNELTKSNGDWSSTQLRHTALLSLGNLLKALNLNVENESEKKLKELNDKILNELLLNELNVKCKSSLECRINVLLAYVNVGQGSTVTNNNDQRQLLSEKVLDSLSIVVLKGHKREAIYAVKALKSLLNGNNAPIINDKRLNNKLKTLIIRLLYDSAQETTTKLLAFECLIKLRQQTNDYEQIYNEFIDNFHWNYDNELSTLIYNRILLDDTRTNQTSTSLSSLLLHVNKLNGSSTIYKRVMGGTNTVNVTNQITMELLKGKLLKQSSFDVKLNDDVEIVAIGLFANGLQSLAGDSSDDNEVSSDEVTQAGMTLTVMSMSLRPIILFTGSGELMGHVWSGTASEPLTAFESTLLLNDYYNEYELIDGQILVQQLRAAMSINLSGEISISLWNRNSHSIVHTSAAVLFHGSQSILWTNNRQHEFVSQQFSFGSEVNLQFITDLDFYSSPFKMCMQLTQPEFVFRHNTRKHQRFDWLSIRNRRIHRRQYKIGGKSFPLNRDNNKICSIMMT